jgi:hypothetical protein
MLAHIRIITQQLVQGFSNCAPLEFDFALTARVGTQRRWYLQCAHIFTCLFIYLFCFQLILPVFYSIWQSTESLQDKIEGFSG